ncbi:YaiI/YqxD family protein [Clostridium saccharoperbutylacetonicum]|uniref:YaiI/YqxD family protein n=1 Tax=Clostridium saccharoperbutylacetonicum TaxID=36745 RepID=UPI0039EBCF6C
MKIIIDGDACPGIPIIEKIAKTYEVPVIIYCDINHFIQSDYSEVKIVDSGFQSVDMYVMNETKQGDIIVSQDYGVAAICLSKKAKVINPKGYIYNEQNIDRLLEERHISQKIRKGGGKTSNPKKRNEDDDLRLEKNLIRIIRE